MNFRKIISLILITVILFSLAALPAVAEEEDTATTVNYVFDNFEDGDLSDWAFRNSQHASQQSATVVEEGGNKFLRLTINGIYAAGTDGGRATTYSKGFSGGAFAFDTSNYTVIDMKIRTNANNMRKYLKFNYPYTSAPYNCFNELGKNTRGLYVMHNNGEINAFSENEGADGYSEYGKGFLVTNYDNNQWYSLRMIVDNANDRADYIILDDDGNAITTITKNLTAWWFNYTGSDKTQAQNWDTIEDITIQFRNDGTWTNEIFDLDDLKLYNQKPVVNTEFISYSDMDFIYKPQKLSVKFDAPINYTEGGIKLYDNENQEVTPAAEEFDETTLTYTASFAPYLPEGSYKFDISGVTPKNVVGTSKMPAMNFDKTQLPFETLDVSPPSASNVEISGRIIDGQMLVADYDFEGDESEDNSVYEWFTAPDESGPWTKIDGAQAAFKELEVEEWMEGLYIKFEVTPKTSLLTGIKKSSNILAPEVAPVATGMAVTPDVIYTGATVTAEYVFSDENGDSEGVSEITWYTSSSADAEDEQWQLVGTGKNYTVTERDAGKYIKFKVIPAAVSDAMQRGEAYPSPTAGPVTSVLEATNLFVNPGMESGQLAPWKKTNGVPEYIGVELTDENPFTGSYALHVVPRINNERDKWGQDVVLEKGKRYLLSAMVRKTSDDAPDVVNFEGYSWSGAINRPYRDAEYTKVTSSTEWKRVTLTFDTTTSGAHTLSFIAYNPINTDVVIDDMYVGPIMVSDIEATDIGAVTIPETGTVTVPVTTGKLFNQFGEAKGFDSQTVNVSVSAPGITADGKNIIINNSAVAGTYDVTLSCTLSYDNSTFSKTIQVELLPCDNTVPQARNVRASGTVGTGNVLTGAYDFYQVEGKEDQSDMKWMFANTEDGTFYDIPGATSATYTVENEYAEKYIIFVVTPKAEGENTGEEVRSNVLTKARPPIAENVSVSGGIAIGEVVTATYDFLDPNEDVEGATTFKWYVSDSENGTYTPISGQSGTTITLTDDLVDKYIKFGVTPVATAEPSVGTEVFSVAYAGPAVPVANNVTITRNDNVLAGNYDYYHIHNLPESESMYSWTVDGVTVSTSVDYVVNFSGTKRVEFTVTPKTVKEPCTGKSVSVVMNITGVSSVSNGTVGGAVTGGFCSVSNGGGGGGGAVSSGGVGNINNMTLTPEKIEEQNTVNNSDIDGHWGAEYIKNMASIGVMSADENGNYQPDEFATREEMLTYLFKALGLEKTEYNNEFTDVADGEFAQMLQTMVDNGTIAKDTSFRPGDTISRQEMCKVLYVSLKNAGKLEDKEEMQIEDLDDYNDIDEWARVYVNGIYANGIMVGVSETKFDAKGTVTKAQAATILTRILGIMEEEAKE